MGAARCCAHFLSRKELYHGRISELDLENQQTELDGHDSKAAEMQTLQAKLIQQHEQKKLPPLRKRRAKSLRQNRLPKRK